MIQTSDAVLAQLDIARVALAEAKTIQETKKILDVASAAEIYAKRQQLGEEAVRYATAIKVEALAQLGRMLKETPRANGGEYGGRRLKIDNTRTVLSIPKPKLTELGLDAKTSKLAQDIAELPEEEIQKVKDGVVTLSKIQAEEKRKKREEKLVEQRQVLKQSPLCPVVHHQDAIEFLNSIPDQSIDLLLTDPPYSTDVDDIYQFVDSWLLLSLRKIKDTGRAYIFTGPYPQELKAYLDKLLHQSRFTIETPLIWTYENTIGPCPSHSYKNNWQAIFYLIGKNADKLDSPNLKEQFSVQDIPAPDGRHGIRYHAWEKPDALAERIIRHSTKPGDSIIDPFSGTGTFLSVASRLQRKATGSEINPNMLEICKLKGCDVWEPTL